MGYTSYILSDKSRNLILSEFPPKFSNIKAHHITYQFGVNEDSPIPELKIAKVIGYKSDDSLECLVVSINGSIYRPDGKIYHITLSLEADRKPAESNALLADEIFDSIGASIEIDAKPSFSK